MQPVWTFLADIFTGIGDLLTKWISNLGAGPQLTSDIIAFVAAGVMATVVLLLLVPNIWLERKIMARLQDRIGPNRVGPWGLFQTIADLLKLLIKEIILPDGADLIPFMLAPILSVMSVVMIWGVVPLTSTTIGSDLNVGVLYIAAVSSFGIVGILMAGWSSNNKYALLGAFRAVAMLVSYEVPLILTMMIPVLLSGSMKVGVIVESQTIAYVFIMPLAALIFMISSIAEVGRQPFDLLEAESEIVSGYHIEYSGFAFAMFYAAEWAHGFTIAALLAALFLGGWRGPGAEQIPSLGIIYFAIKTWFLYLVQIWIRATVPRMRIDQIMSFCWKFLVPVSLILLVLSALVDKIAQQILPNYVVTGTFVEMLPRFLVLLVVNVIVGAIASLWVTLAGRRERQRQERLQVAAIETGAR